MHIMYCKGWFSNDVYLATQDGGCSLVHKRVITIIFVFHVIEMLSCA